MASKSRPAAVAVPDSTGACSRDAAWPTRAGLVQSSRVFSVLSRSLHVCCVASSRGVCLILPDQPLFRSHLCGYRTRLNVPDRGIYGYAARPFACSHKATCPRWPDLQCGQDALDSKSWESMSLLLCLSENRNLLFQTDHPTLQADIIPAGLSPLL